MASVAMMRVSHCRVTRIKGHVHKCHKGLGNRHSLWMRDAHRGMNSSIQRKCTGSDSNACTLHEAMSEISAEIRQGIVAVGSGDLVAAFLEHVATRDDIGDVKFAPTSLSVESELKMLGLPRVSELGKVDVFVDQADHVHVVDGEVSYIVGTGENGPQVGQPDIPLVQRVAGSAPRVILLTHQRQGDITSTRLSGQLPILIEGDELEWEEYAEEIDDIFLGDGEITRRSNSEDANTRGMPDPVITSDGNMILDVAFYKDLRLYGQSVPYSDIARAVEGVDGVVVTGLVQCQTQDKESITVHQIHTDDATTCILQTTRVV